MFIFSYVSAQILFLFLEFIFFRRAYEIYTGNVYLKKCSSLLYDVRGLPENKNGGTGLNEK